MKLLDKNNKVKEKKIRGNPFGFQGLKMGLRPEPNQYKDKQVSKNKYAKKVVGLRNIPKNTIIFDQPCELDYHCPVCKYENEVDGNYDQRLEWSEYNGFIWCRSCNKDYPTCLCIPDKDKATEIYLSCVEDAISQSVEQERKKWLNLPCMEKESERFGDKFSYIRGQSVGRNQLRQEIKQTINKEEEK